MIQSISAVAKLEKKRAKIETLKASAEEADKQSQHTAAINIRLEATVRKHEAKIKATEVPHCTGQ